MKTMFDPKSALLGAVAVIVIASIFGAKSLSGPDVGRFQIQTSEHHAFVLDTTTGRVWEKHLTSSKGINAKNFRGSKLDAQP